MRHQKCVRAAAVAALLAGSMFVAGPAAAAGTVPNGSFEAGPAGGSPTCWSVSGPARFTVTGTGHSGRAASVVGQSTVGSRLKLTTDRTDSCRIPAAPGEVLVLGFWLQSTAGARPLVYTRSAAGWRHWFTGTKLPAGPLAQQAVRLPALPPGVTQVSVGFAFNSRSSVVLDDVTLTSAGPPPPPPPGPGVLFQATFPPTDTLVTNEFAYWSPHNPRRADSPDWEMTSGSLFAHAGSGFTGPVNNRPADAQSRTGTNSAVFRLTTRDDSFRDVAVRLNLNIAGLTSTSTTPPVDWDGVHIFLRYRSEYELYYASVARRDGTVLIKKKCRGGPINGGRYYQLSAEVHGMPIPYGRWQRVGATVRTNANGSVTITLSRDDRTVVTATDTGVGCAPITLPGATGLRGDNASFLFNDFTVTSLG